MNTLFVRRRQTHHNHVGVCSDADMFQAHGRLTVRARGPRQQTAADAARGHRMRIDIDAIQARFDDWYGSNEDLEPSGYGQADWSLRDGSDETLSHCIVREDVPLLVREVERLTRELELTLNEWSIAQQALAQYEAAAEQEG